MAVERNARHPDNSGLDVLLQAPVSAGGRAVTSKFNTYITDRLKERAQVWKQERLYREERRHQDHSTGGGGGHGGGGGKGKGKGK